MKTDETPQLVRGLNLTGAIALIRRGGDNG